MPDEARGFAERLTALCAIDSPTGDADGVGACVGLLAGWAAAAGCTVDVLQEASGPHLIATLAGTRPGRVLLIGHADTVFPLGTAAARPLRLEGDRVLGPGVADMKGGLLVALAAIERLAREGGERPAVELHVVPDEEGRTGAPATLQRWRGADAALTFECGRASGAVVSARKAGTWVTVEARGRGSHAGSAPEQGRSALRALAREALRIEAELDGARPGMTANVTVVQSGSIQNAIPEHGTMTVDLRATTSADLLWAIERTAAFGAHDGVELTASREPGFPPLLRDEGLTLAALSGLEGLGEPPLEETAGGVSDASWASSLGIPSLDGLGPVGADDHTEREWIDLRSVEPRVLVTAELCRYTRQP